MRQCNLCIKITSQNLFLRFRTSWWQNGREKNESETKHFWGKHSKLYLATWLTRRVWNSKSRSGSRLSQMRFWLYRTATPWHSHREHSTSSTWNTTCQHLIQQKPCFFLHWCHTDIGMSKLNRKRQARNVIYKVKHISFQKNSHSMLLPSLLIKSQILLFLF